jgi:hypothetical protein
MSVTISGQQRSATTNFGVRLRCTRYYSGVASVALIDPSCFAAWVLDSTCRPCLLDRMLTIFDVLACEGVFLVYLVIVSHPGLLYTSLLDAFLLGFFSTDSCAHPW